VAKQKHDSGRKKQDQRRAAQKAARSARGGKGGRDFGGKRGGKGKR